MCRTISLIIMPERSIFARMLLLLAVLGVLALSACNNQYGPPPANGQPQNWGQQHYLDNQRYQQLNLDRAN
jgi:hypothetical protein